MLLTLLMQYIVVFMTKKHEVKYSIKTDDNSYMIFEEFDGHDGSNYYFKIEDNDKNVFNFSYSGDLNKQEEIISDIKFFNDDKLKCIFPIYKGDRTNGISCILDEQQVSYTYLKQINNNSIDKFVTKLKKEGYKVINETEKKGIEKVGNYVFYKGNIFDNVIFTMWFYKGFYIIRDNEIIEKELLTKDKYENDLAKLVNNFYVFVNTDDDGLEYSEIFVYDIKNGGKATIQLDSPISNFSYFNGVYNNKLYITDIKKKAQYMVNPNLETVSLVGNEEDGFVKLSLDGKLETEKASVFLKDEVYFDNKVETPNTRYDIVDLVRDEHTYYFRTKDNEFYKSFNKELDNPILLFKTDTVSEWKVKNGKIMIIVDNSMLYFDEEYGLLKILENNELKYNYKNICDFIVE